MSRSRHSSLLLVLLLVFLGGGGAAAWMVMGPEETIEAFEPALQPQEAVPSLPTTSDQTAMTRPEPAGREGDAMTSVEVPLILELQQVQRGTFGDPGELLPPGSGANARLKGRLTGDRGDGLTGTVSFIAGPNQGRELRTDSSGEFGASDLYQGLSVVHVETDTGIHSEREVLLRQLSTSELNLALSRREACMVRGTVRDTAGEPLQGVEVRLDGGTAITDDQGEFYFPRVAPGTRTLLLLEKKGYARQRQTIPIPRGGVVEASKLTFAMIEGADLRLNVAALVGAPGPTQVFIFPVGGRPVNSQFGQRTFPWHMINPVEIHPGGTVLVEGLQPGHVKIMAFHPGAIASPPWESKKLLVGRENGHVIKFRKAPVIEGVVLDPEGKPVNGARVLLEAPNRGFATTKVMQQKPTFNESMILPHLPSALQETKSDRRGRFQLTIFPDISKGYYLTVLSKDGSMRANRVLRAEPDELEVHLEPVTLDTGELRVGLAGRFQGLPVRVVINGSPRDEFVLSATDDLVVEDLDAGIWRAIVWWNDEHLERGEMLTIEANRRSEFDVVLPTPALTGPAGD